ncbi:MAG: flagellar hook assembly protein FlgD [Betaproteobacteria bacterium]|nr:flagellar hook assembly protein FlgD [Betaproteobacteria bacterium]MCL2885311.1 flagellar hook assembly protein FlgD [Betaproteobacteria bacterium]
MATIDTSNAAANAADLLTKAGGRTNTPSGSTAAEVETRFLTLLMAQMRNQDPLNPLDNAQVTTQMAQLSTVTGIEHLNASLGQLLTGYNEALAMQSANLIGKNVMIAGNGLPMVDGQSVGGVWLAGPADSVQLTIRDASGKVVQVEDLGRRDAGGNFYFVWDGTDAEDNLLPNGQYSFSIAASYGGQKVDGAPMQIGMVSAVTRGKDGFLLELGSLGTVAFQDVQQIL